MSNLYRQIIRVIGKFSFGKQNWAAKVRISPSPFKLHITFRYGQLLLYDFLYSIALTFKLFPHILSLAYHLVIQSPLCIGFSCLLYVLCVINTSTHLSSWCTLEISDATFWLCAFLFLYFFFFFLKIYS